MFWVSDLKACLAMNDFWLAWYDWCTRQGETEVLNPILCHVLRIRQVRIAMCLLDRIMKRGNGTPSELMPHL